MQPTSDEDSTSRTDTFDPHALIEEVIHDCALCRALRAQSALPLVDLGEDLFAKRDVIRERRPRGRNLKYSARR